MAPANWPRSPGPVLEKRDETADDDYDGDNDGDGLRPAKRRRTNLTDGALGRNDDGDGDRDPSPAVDHCAAAIPAHPLGIKPSGNAFAEAACAAGRGSVRSGAGLFALLPDELLAGVLERLGPAELRAVGATCRALWAFAQADELWRGLFVGSSPGRFSWRGSWRNTYLQLPAASAAAIDCTGLYSDVLYRPFQCAHAPLEPWIRGIPRAHEIARLSDMTATRFGAEWAGTPFILTGPVKEWPIYGAWSVEHLVENFPEIAFRAEAVDWPLKTYVEYMRSQAEESPLYLFDRAFAEKMDLKVGSVGDKEGAAYWPPDCFGEDLFAILGDQRPDHRWLIVGPQRSGSTFHKDPNATSAWNAVLKGCKYWLMFPSSANTPPPPGVILSDDASEITSPVSIAEYMLVFHEIARATSGCKEGICHAGEILHVPSGWFHLVVNLEESIAVTQNFVPKQKLADVMRFLRDSPDQVSGFEERVSDPYGLFVERLQQKHPALLQEALRKLDQNDQERTGKWRGVKNGDGIPGVGGFSFGFGGGSGDEDVDVP